MAQEMGFINTLDADRILAVCVVTEQSCGIGVILGAAGTGKTFAVKYFAERSDKAVYIKVDGVMNCSNLIRHISRKCGFEVPPGSIWEMKNSLIEFLQTNPKTLIIDEADKLFQANSIKRVEILRDIHEETAGNGTALILAGAPFIESFLSRRTIKENYGQIDSRIDYGYKTLGLTAKEIQKAISGMKIDQKAQKAIAETVLKSSRSSIRCLAKILARCFDIAGDEMVTTATVVQACNIMMM